jgi:CheY-like chemotaxis protein
MLVMPVMSEESKKIILPQLEQEEKSLWQLRWEKGEEGIKLAKELGIHEYLIKPVKKSDVLQAIRSVMGTKQASRDLPVPDMEPVAAQELPPLKILLVEDTRDNVILLQAYFKKTACEIDIAENGAVAVEKFKQTGYDVVLMDVQMPVMDGYTATRKIREWEGEHHRKPTPVLALTAHALKEDEQKSLDAGCNAHITKPIKKAALFEAIKRIVR